MAAPAGQAWRGLVGREAPKGNRDSRCVQDTRSSHPQDSSHLCHHPPPTSTVSSALGSPVSLQTSRTGPGPDSAHLLCRCRGLAGSNGAAGRNPGRGDKGHTQDWAGQEPAVSCRPGDRHPPGLGRWLDPLVNKPLSGAQPSAVTSQPLPACQTSSPGHRPAACNCLPPQHNKNFRFPGLVSQQECPQTADPRHVRPSSPPTPHPSTFTPVTCLLESKTTAGINQVSGATG